MVVSGHMLLPLHPPAISCHRDTPAGPHPPLLDMERALLLVVLLSIGNTVDGAVGGAFVGVLVRKLLLPVASILGQRPTEAAPEGPGGRNSDREGGLLLGNLHTEKDCLLVCLAQRLGTSVSALRLGSLEAALDCAGCLLPRLVSGLHSRARGETRVKGCCGHLQGRAVNKVNKHSAAGKSSSNLIF